MQQIKPNPTQAQEKIYKYNLEFRNEYEIISHYLGVGRCLPLLMITDSQTLKPHTRLTSMGIHRDRSRSNFSLQKILLSKKNLNFEYFDQHLDLDCKINTLISNLLLLLLLDLQSLSHQALLLDVWKRGHPTFGCGKEEREEWRHGEGRE